MNKAKEISDRMIRLAARTIKITEAIAGTFAGKKIADQLVRSVTSIGANYEEGHGTHSRADFANKLQIALKEARETRYWLAIIVEAGLAPELSVDLLLDEASQLCAILGKSVATVRGSAKPAMPSRAIDDK